MGRYNSGWCGSCGCDSCDCHCGRKTVIQQSSSSCCNTSTGARFCKEPLVYLTSNFTVPAANTEVEITVSDSAKLYAGQGIQIGTHYFQILEIVDSRTIKIAHNGTATPAATITAVSPSYGCYQFPIYYVGIVELIFEPDDIEGLDEDFAIMEDSISDVAIAMTYGYLGPYKVQFNLELSLTSTVTPPNYISFTLPDAVAEPGAVFSCIYNPEETLYLNGIAYKSGTKIIIGPGLEGNGDYIFKVSGEYGI